MRTIAKDILLLRGIVIYIFFTILLTIVRIICTIIDSIKLSAIGINYYDEFDNHQYEYNTDYKYLFDEYIYRVWKFWKDKEH